MPGSGHSPARAHARAGSNICAVVWARARAHERLESVQRGGESAQTRGRRRQRTSEGRVSRQCARVVGMRRGSNLQAAAHRDAKKMSSPRRS
eukprot:1656060-Prymnesium_polylepis.2